MQFPFSTLDLYPSILIKLGKVFILQARSCLIPLWHRERKKTMVWRHQTPRVAATTWIWDLKSFKSFPSGLLSYSISFSSSPSKILIPGAFSCLLLRSGSAPTAGTTGGLSARRRLLPQRQGAMVGTQYKQAKSLPLWDLNPRASSIVWAWSPVWLVLQRGTKFREPPWRSVHPFTTYRVPKEPRKPRYFC